MSDRPEVTLEQLRDMLDLLRRTVEAGAEQARRIEVLEKAAKDSFDVIVRLQENQQQLLDAFETQSNLQNRLNADFAAAIERLQGKDTGLVM